MPEGPSVSEALSAEKQAKPYLLRLLVLVLAFYGVFACVFFTGAGEPLRMPLTAVAPVLLIYAVWLAAGLLQSSHRPIPATAFFAGALFIVGGAALDMAATITHTPDLENEINLFVIALRANHWSMGSIYVYSLVCQSLFQAFLCTLWAAFLRHSREWLSLLADLKPNPGWEFAKAASGGAHLTWRQLMLPMRLSELPRMYPCALVIILAMCSASAGRWYYGLEWVGAVPLTSSGVYFATSVFVVGALVEYRRWLWWQYKLLVRRAEPDAG